MTPSEQLELDELKQKLRQTESLLKQEQGKNIALEQNRRETERTAKKLTEEAQAYRNETDLSLAEASHQMKLALSVSQGIWSLGQLGRTYMARKIAAGRVCYRESQAAILMQQVIDAHKTGNTTALQAGLDKMAQIVRTVKEDGETNRVAAIEASQAYGLKMFEAWWPTVISEENDAYSEDKQAQA